jgi:hypothetical protein
MFFTSPFPIEETREKLGVMPHCLPKDKDTISKKSHTQFHDKISNCGETCAILSTFLSFFSLSKEDAFNLIINIAIGSKKTGKKKMK